MTLAELILKIADLVTKWSGELASHDRRRLSALADYLEGIAGTLTRTATLLTNAELPTAECEELRVHLANLMDVLNALGASDKIDRANIALLERELNTAINAPISAVQLLTRSRWALLGNYHDANAPVVVGKKRVAGELLPVRIGVVNQFSDRLIEYRRSPDYLITIDAERALSEELNTIHIAAGRFHGSAKVLRALATR